MDTLKKLFPYSFGAKDVGSFIVKIIVYIVVGAVGGAIVGLLSGLKFVGWLFAILGSVLSIYVFAGIVILILVYCKVIK